MHNTTGNTNSVCTGGERAASRCGGTPPRARQYGAIGGKGRWTEAEAEACATVRGGSAFFPPPSPSSSSPPRRCCEVLHAGVQPASRSHDQGGTASRTLQRVEDRTAERVSTRLPCDHCPTHSVGDGGGCESTPPPPPPPTTRRGASTRLPLRLPLPAAVTAPSRGCPHALTDSPSHHLPLLSAPPLPPHTHIHAGPERST